MSCPRCGEPLDEADDQHHCSAVGILKDEDTDVHLVTPGDVLDERWRIEGRLGAGAMGSVFEGFDLKRKVKVAIKILAPRHCRKAKVLARFEREARLMTTLRHDNIVQLHGVGRRGALPYIVMEKLEGLTLAEHLKRKGGKLSPVETLFIVRQVCSGLSFIHHHKLIHRDIKPHNIFIGADDHVTILDLGVVRDASDPGLTTPGAMIGTPYYMAPEQILGKGEIDRRADVYALGAVIFELLTGTPPFVAPSNFEVLYAHRTLPPPDASLLSTFVPKPVAKVINRALAKSPADRQNGAQELIAEFEAAYCLDDERTNPGVPVSMIREGRRPTVAAPKVEPTRRPSSREIPRVSAPAEDDEPPMVASGEVELVSSGFGEEQFDLLRSRPSTAPDEMHDPSAANTHEAGAVNQPAATVAERTHSRETVLDTMLGEVPPEKTQEAGEDDPPAATVLERSPAKVRTPTAPSKATVSDRSPLKGRTATPVAARVESKATVRARAPLKGRTATPAVFETELRDRAPSDSHDGEEENGADELEHGELRVVTTLNGLTSGANLYVDGQPSGSTPSFLRISAGPHRIRVERSGFQEIDKEVFVQANQITLIRVTLQKKRSPTSSG